MVVRQDGFFINHDAGAYLPQSAPPRIARHLLPEKPLVKVALLFNNGSRADVNNGGARALNRVDDGGSPRDSKICPRHSRSEPDKQQKEECYNFFHKPSLEIVLLSQSELVSAMEN